jgi:hypothetical protein
MCSLTALALILHEGCEANWFIASVAQTSASTQAAARNNTTAEARALAVTVQQHYSSQGNIASTKSNKFPLTGRRQIRPSLAAFVARGTWRVAHTNATHQRTPYSLAHLSVPFTPQRRNDSRFLAHFPLLGCFKSEKKSIS